VLYFLVLRSIATTVLYSLSLHDALPILRFFRIPPVVFQILESLRWNPFPEGIRSVTVDRFQFLQECQNQVLRPQGPMDHSAKSNPGHTSCLLLLCCQGSSFNHMIAWYYRLVNMFFAKRTKKIGRVLLWTRPCVW